MKDKNENTESGVLTPEQLIKTQLEKFNLADSVIAELDVKYRALKIKDVDDKEGIKKVSEARKDIKSKRVSVEKVRKGEGDFYLKTKKAIDAEAKRITEKLTPIEEYLEAEETRIEQEVAKAKQTELEKAMLRTNTRMERLAKVGGAMDFEKLKSLTDEEFEIEFQFIEADILLAPVPEKPATVSYGGHTVNVHHVGIGTTPDHIADMERILKKESDPDFPDDFYPVVTLQRPLIFHDIESTGLNWEKDEPIEIAIVRVMPDGSIEEWHSYLKPEKMAEIPIEITAITGITWDMVKDSPTFAEVADKIYPLVTDGDLAGYNIVGFDVPFLSQKFSNVKKLFPLLDQQFVDVSNIYRKFNPRTLADAYLKYIGEEMENAHSATADTYATFEVFKAQIGEHGEQTGTTIESISKFCMDGFVFVDAARKLSMDKDGDVIYNIGKAKGEKVKNDPSFAEWMLAQTWITEHTRAILRREMGTSKLSDLMTDNEPFKGSILETQPLPTIDEQAKETNVIRQEPARDTATFKPIEVPLANNIPQEYDEDELPI